MKKFKILFLTHKFYPDIGGIEVNSEVLATEFAKAGYEVRLATWSMGEAEKDFGFKVVRNPNLISLLKLHFWADVVFENNPCLKLSWPAVFSSRPLVLALRTWVARSDGSLAWQDKLKMWWIKRASGVIAVSNAVRIRSASSATVIGNPYRNEIFKDFNDNRRRFSFVFLGRFVSDKGANIAIDAFSKILKNQDSDGSDQFKLTLIGNGPEFEALKQMTQSLAISEFVEFTGHLKGTELAAKLNEHRYLLVPSLWEEPFGNVVLEGMACGCLPFVSNSGGLPDAVGKAGITFDPHSPDGLFKAIKKLLETPAVEQAYRDNIKTHLLAHEPGIVARRYLEIIQNAGTKR